MKRDEIKREDFDKVCDVVWSEIKYQDGLSRRTDDEAKDPAGFLTLLSVYVRKAQDAWADSAGNEKALHGLRKIAAIAVRAMVYSGARFRDKT